MTPHSHSSRRSNTAAAAPLFALLLLAATAAACARSTSSTPRGSTSGGGGASGASASSSRSAGQWTAALETVGGSGVGGSALITQSETSGETSVTLQVTGAPPNGTLPWHLHTGRCGEAGGTIVGQPQAYTPIAVRADGTSGQHRVNLPFPVPTTGDFRVQVHRSATDMGTIVACGNLIQM